ncbi:MAG: AAA family ATPase [Pseudanabaena sp. CRU_2_10]|nr:AAA family ATPase [Pseudanabaena sp. CRU_2_10]
MLKRIYIDNFRCLVNFELTVDSINLFLGENGSGKSTVFEVLRKIQALVSGESRIYDIFMPSDFTRWQTSPNQIFELEIEGNGGIYKYELAIQYVRERPGFIVKHERLWFDKQLLLKFEFGEVQIYGNDGTERPNYSYEWTQSVLPSIPSRGDTTNLTGFRDCMERFIIVQITPGMMVEDSDREEKRLSSKMQNYVSWYRFLSQDQGKIIKLTNALKDILDGFVSFTFDQVGEQKRILKLNFSKESDSKEIVKYRFGELSDGQRMLISLYTLIYCTQSENYTLCIDEPENFLALPEIQPWLDKLYDFCSEKRIQALLISHHPKLINFLASSVGYWFDRKSNTPVRVKPIKDEHDTGLPISELIARGWLYDPE